MTNCKFKVGDKVRRVKHITTANRYQTSVVVVRDVEWVGADNRHYLSFNKNTYAEWDASHFELVEG